MQCKKIGKIARKLPSQVLVQCIWNWWAINIIWREPTCLLFAFFFLRNPLRIDNPLRKYHHKVASKVRLLLHAWIIYDLLYLSFSFTSMMYFIIEKQTCLIQFCSNRLKDIFLVFFIQKVKTKRVWTLWFKNLETVFQCKCNM